MSLPTVAVIGRPNVGKSTLFNRLVGYRQAVVSDIRGTTRDRIYGEVEWSGRRFRIIDAGGFEEKAEDALGSKVQEHLRRAIGEADALLFLLDSRDGILTEDNSIMEMLRKSGKPVVLAVNKLENGRAVPPEFHRFGVEALLPISALHGLGVGDLLDALLEELPADPGQQAGGQGMPSIAIVGRPNVGKSSMFNMLLQEERVIVSDVPGTTRDAVDTFLEIHGQPLRLIDTAGWRRRKRIHSPVDIFSMFRTERMLERADVAIVVLDAAQPVVREDQLILEKVFEERRGCVIALNKWDLIEETNQRALLRSVQGDAPFLKKTPMLATSAKTGFGVFRALEKALRVNQNMRHPPEAVALAERLQSAWTRQPPPRFRGRTVSLRHVRWARDRAVTLELLIAPVARLTRSYQHYLLNVLHEDPVFDGVPLQLSVVEPVQRARNSASRALNARGKGRKR